MCKLHHLYATLFTCLLTVSSAVCADERQAREPFHFVDSGRCPFGHCTSNELVAPKGKRMVIETFSITVTLATSQDVTSMDLRQVTDDGGTVPLHAAAVSGPRPFLGGQVFVASQQVRLYPTPGMPVIALAEITDQEGGAFTVTIDGYFLPVGSPSLSP
ncbi:hypothetical protein [Methylocaldum sp.]|uniref:hypothetical protein n=1 Tax=Methylocaldum sp. TaxID=1969727 RepID=UPI002D5A0ED4|nr:hypothetical protein [Methylocaldum sp.]HYE35278.1 hypothetical protein [Methylocaldum sp.]